MIQIKNLASLITIGRIAGSLLLFLIKPLSAAFFTVYFLCCVSDVLDGYIARKTNTTSKIGETLDSIADFVLIAVMLAVFFPLIAWEPWQFYWIGIIAVVRLVSLAVGFAKYHAIAFLHTYANKATGIVCACFLFLYQGMGLTAAMLLTCGIASLSALEELIITVSSNRLDRNAKGLFFDRTR